MRRAEPSAEDFPLELGAEALLLLPNARAMSAVTSPASNSGRISTSPS
jgi:hypothetical protein